MNSQILNISFLLMQFYFCTRTFELTNFQEFNYINHTDKHILERHSGCYLSLDKCAKLCKYHVNCVSIFYKNMSQQCQLHSASLTSLTEFDTSAGWRYYEMNIEDCSQLYDKGSINSGVYLLQINGRRYDVYCDMTTNGGGWTVFQRRFDGSVDFYKGWDEYANGFGEINGEYWLGNEYLYELTSQNAYKLRIDMEDHNGTWKYAEYSYFSLSSNETDYTLNVGTYSGTAGDSLSYHNGNPFSTKDFGIKAACAISGSGAWWYDQCHTSNLNGLYNVTVYAKSNCWKTWHGHSYPLKTTGMKIKRL